MLSLAHRGKKLMYIPAHHSQRDDNTWKLELETRRGSCGKIMYIALEIWGKMILNF